MVRRMGLRLVLNASDPSSWQRKGEIIEFGLVLVTRVVSAARQQRGQEHEGACRRLSFTQMHSCSAVMQSYGQEQEMHNGGNPSCDLMNGPWELWFWARSVWNVAYLDCQHGRLLVGAVRAGRPHSVATLVQLHT